MIKLTDIDVFAISIPLKSPIKMAGIVVSSADNLIVRITDDAGRTGWGEAASAPTMTGEFPEGMVAAGRFLAATLIGTTLRDTAEIQPALDATLYGNQGPKAAFECAILDLMAQAQNVPLYALFGGKLRQSAPVLTMVAGGDPQAEVANATAAAAAGFTAFKVKVGVGYASVDLARCRMIREALGPDVQISADANQGYDLAQALDFAHGAEHAGLDFMEQLVNGHDLAGMARCAAATSVALGADEGLHEISDIQAHHDHLAATGGSLKTIKLGGALPVMAAGRLMDSLDMAVNLAGKVAETSIASAAIAHLALALPRLDWGTSVTNQYLSDDVTDTPIRIIDGQVSTPEGPGLGIRPNLEKLDQYRMRFHD
jgi:muconate cycloisomerase